MDKKMRAHRRPSFSSSSSSSSASSLASSSSSSSSFESRRQSGSRARSGYRDQSRSKKSRPSKYSGAGDRPKQKKSKNSSSSMRKHSSSKSSTRKSSHGHNSRKEYKEISREFAVKEHAMKDYGHSYKSRSPPLHHHKRSGVSKKSGSPVRRAFSPVGRKSRKRSPSLHKKVYRRSTSRDRLDFHHTLSPSRPRDPRIERALKRSPEVANREARYRHERDPHEERRRDDRESRDGRDKKLLKDRITFKDRFADRDSDREEGRFTRDPRQYEGEREFYPRVESRDSSLERKSYDDLCERFERERNRIENRNRFEELSHERLISSGDYPLDPRDTRRRQVPIESRYADDRRKIGRDMWPDDQRNPGSSMMDRLQEPEPRAYPHHRRSGDWMAEGQGRRMNETVGWDKHSPQKRRGPEWVDSYSGNEWRDRPREWEPAMGDPTTEWHPRRYHNTWNEGERGEWSGNVRKRIAVKSPNLPPPSVSQIAGVIREPSPPIPEPIVDVTSTEDAAFVKPEVKSFSPLSPSKQPVDEEKPSPSKEEKDEPTSPAVDLQAVEKDNFSDFSDDSDDILNQEAVALPEEKLELVDAEESKITPVDATSYDELLEEEKMDLEEISDDDFEEEKQVKYSVANALDIDWSTLTVDPNTQPVAAKTSALKRFSSINILSRLGVSSKYARKDFLDYLVDKCYQMEINRVINKKVTEKKLADDRDTEDGSTCKVEPMDVTVKEEKVDEITNETEDKDKQADKPEVVAEEVSQILPVVVAEGVVRHIRQPPSDRSKIFYLGRKALSAKDDIIIRRRLCNLPDDDILFEKPQFNKDLFESSLSLLKA